MFADEMYSRSQVSYALAEFALTKTEYARALAIADEMLARLRPGSVTVSIPWLLFQKSRALAGLARHTEARAVLQQARQRAESANQRTILWRILAAQAALSGDVAEALALRDQAHVLLEFIVAHAPSDEWRSTFLARPDVRTLLAHVEASP